MITKTVARTALSVVRSVLAGFFCLLCFSGPVFGYPCGDPGSGHCYGRATWQEKDQYFGAYTDLTQVSMRCPSGCGGFVDDEIWLIDTKSRGCSTNGFGLCWVEAGYIFTDGSSNAQFFWADGRPLTDSAFNLHILGPADPVGATDHYMILKDGRAEAGIFQVWVFNDGLTTLYQGTSSNNTMSADRIDIGQELAGVKDASAATASFTRNIWAVQALGPEYVFWYNRQINKGSVVSNNPPFASWLIDPASPPPPEGGLFTTYCCS